MAGALWGKEEEATLVELYPEMPNEEIANRLNAVFGNARTKTTVCQRAIKLGVKKVDGYVRPKPHWFWNDERVAWFRAFVPGHTESEISAEHERVFGFPLSESQIGNAKNKFNVKSGTRGGCFQKGHEPANKGKTWDEFMSPEGQAASRRTCFEKGHMPANTHDLLDEREGKDGYIFIKVCPRNAKYPMRYWIPKAQFVWMQANGRDWPEGHRCIFVDHDKLNLDPDNIVPVPADLYPLVMGAVRGSVPYYDRESLEVAITAAKVMRARVDVRKRMKGAKHD